MRDPATIPATVGIHNATTKMIWIAGYAALAPSAGKTITMTDFDTNALQPPFGPTIKSLVFQSIADLHNQGLITFTDGTTLTADDDLAGVVTGTDTLETRPGMPGYHVQTSQPRLVSATITLHSPNAIETYTSGLYRDAACTLPLIAADFAITFHQNSGTATAAAIASIKKVGGATLTGGETQIQINLTITGSISGVETIDLTPTVPFYSKGQSLPSVISQATARGLLLTT
jgi:hypothetical protein